MNTIWFVVILIAASAVTIYLSMVSGTRYSQHDAESHAADYASVIKEAHGPLTAFLWVSYAAIVVWMVVYLVQHGGEFAGML
jgi:uncharacterized protein (UPF0333 family)